MFMSSVKRECEICSCDKNDHTENLCLSCKQNIDEKQPHNHAYVDSSASIERMSQYNLHLMYKSYGGFWL